MFAAIFIQYSLLCIIAGCIAKLFLLTRPPKGLPPGPRPLPLLGNIRDMPPKGGRNWNHWASFKELYGPISSLTTMGTTMIVIHDYNLAVELLEKKSSISSDRAQPTFLAEMYVILVVYQSTVLTDDSQVSMVSKLESYSIVSKQES